MWLVKCGDKTIKKQDEDIHVVRLGGTWLDELLNCEVGLDFNVDQTCIAKR